MKSLREQASEWLTDKSDVADKPAPVPQQDMFPSEDGINQLLEDTEGEFIP
jgi:hypothetical protein